mgnify:CR=1 FL=1
MRYENVVSGKFIARPNRFIAEIEIDGKTEICHVMNTGRMKELLVPGVKVFLTESKNPVRKTKYDLGRIGFLKEAWAWKEKYESNIINQQKKNKYD